MDISLIDCTTCCTVAVCIKCKRRFVYSTHEKCNKLKQDSLIRANKFNVWVKWIERSVGRSVETSTYLEFAANVLATDEFGELPALIAFIRRAHQMPRKHIMTSFFNEFSLLRHFCFCSWDFMFYLCDYF